VESAAVPVLAPSTDLAARPVEATRPLLRGWSHVVALGAVLIGGPWLILASPNAGATVVLTVYVLSLVGLFGVSAAFHVVHWSPEARRRMRRADHTTIFVAIAGSYTAFAGLVLQGWAQALVLCLVWGGLVAGVTIRQLWLDAPKWAITLPYVVVGWCALVVAPAMLRGLGPAGFALVLAGGVFYTVGAAVYALKWPDPAPRVFGYHEVFHACTVIGALLQFIAVAAFALPHA
jgi:hemolysin III